MRDDPQTLRAASERLDQLLRGLDAHGDETVRQALHEVVGLLMAMHREGLEQAVALAGDSSLGGPALLARLADDPLVGPLLLVHDVHPYPADVRIGRAFERLRPQIAARGCRATVEGVVDGVAHVRLEGSLTAPRAAELRQLIEDTLLEAAPEISNVTFVESSPREPALIQIQRHPPSSSAPAGPQS